MTKMRVPFVVGRMNANAAELVVVERRQPAPIPGPWRLEAWVQPASRVRLVRL